MLTCILLSLSLIARGFVIASDRSQMLIIQRNASLASLIQQIHRSDPISNSSDLEGLIVEPLRPSSKNTKERDLDTTNEYDIASRDGKYVIVKRKANQQYGTN